ncbi:MAG: 7-cyano-7-deazaguanine synthase QueC [Candidatus Omnitrophica bacterium]|nr:7-cyano-7-deazaguanine synthase QueC [Candidatus Omnitrophota bacterium]MCF7887862.1 7-cyano-7-deazaguanine synthase QueC [Candidatus Omnitrophota bacterium]
MKKEKAIILLSGGLDSATTLFLAKQKNFSIKALIFDYGQKHKKEIKAAKKIAKIAKVGYRIVTVKIPWSKSSLTDTAKKVPEKFTGKIPSTYVPGRNIIFLSYAASFAEAIGARAIFIGAHTQDYSGYPDCRKNFLEKFNQAVNLGIAGKRIKLHYPLISKNKKEIIQLGLRLGVPFKYTWSCYNGSKYPCQRCDSCRFRINGFNQLGLTDPLLKNKY